MCGYPRRAEEATGSLKAEVTGRSVTRDMGARTELWFSGRTIHS